MFFLICLCSQSGEHECIHCQFPSKKDTNKSLKKDKSSNKVNKEEVQGKSLEKDKLSKELKAEDGQGKSLEKDKPSKEVKKEDGQGKSLEKGKSSKEVNKEEDHQRFSLTRQTHRHSWPGKARTRNVSRLEPGAPWLGS